MPASLKLAFGTSAKQQIAARLRAHVVANFDNNSKKAAENLGISRQRLFSYTSGKTFPRLPMLGVISERWGLNLVGEIPHPQTAAMNRGQARDLRSTQRSLFESPVTLKSDGLKVVIKRKGPRLVASIEIATDVEIA
jgi:hypothetical protein